MASKLETRLSEHERRIAQHDREIAGIRKLLAQGARMLLKLAAAQEKTEKSLDRLIHSLERSGSNGHRKTNLDLQ